MAGDSSKHPGCYYFYGGNNKDGTKGFICWATSELRRETAQNRDRSKQKASEDVSARQQIENTTTFRWMPKSETVDSEVIKRLDSLTSKVNFICKQLEDLTECIHEVKEIRENLESISFDTDQFQSKKPVKNASKSEKKQEKKQVKKPEKKQDKKIEKKPVKKTKKEPAESEESSELPAKKRRRE